MSYDYTAEDARAAERAAQAREQLERHAVGTVVQATRKDGQQLIGVVDSSVTHGAVVVRHGAQELEVEVRPGRWVWYASLTGEAPRGAARRWGMPARASLLSAMAEVEAVTDPATLAEWASASAAVIRQSQRHSGSEAGT